LYTISLLAQHKNYSTNKQWDLYTIPILAQHKIYSTYRLFLVLLNFRLAHKCILHELWVDLKKTSFCNNWLAVHLVYLPLTSSLMVS
jgi:hypothetical protein